MHISKQVLGALMTVIQILTVRGSSGQEHASVHQSHRTDPVATHNMLILGEKSVYLSHLPMFQEKNTPVMPHRYQVLLEVSIGQQGDSSQKKYTEDRQKNPTKIYTLNPEEFILPTLVSADSQQVLRSFNATIFRGHLEKLKQGEGAILEDVDVNVKRVVHFREFSADAKKSAQLEYLLIGKGKELFLVHQITAPPDFDQILAVKSMDTVFSNEALSKGILIIFPGTINAASKRLKPEQQFTGDVKSGSSPAAKKVKIVISGELYFEEGELRTPPIFEATEEEKKAGFH